MIGYVRYNSINDVDIEMATRTMRHFIFLLSSKDNRDRFDVSLLQNGIQSQFCYCYALTVGSM